MEDCHITQQINSWVYIYMKRVLIQKETWTLVFTAALFTIIAIIYNFYQ